jgi:ureidoglycolate lyase
LADIVLRPIALTAEAFAPFGDVIDTRGRAPLVINEGTCRRFDDLASIDVAAEGGRPVLSVFESTYRELPLRIRALERHPLASQAFFPLDAWPFLILVAESDAAVAAGRLRVFLSSGNEGVNYRRNVWHHSLLALARPSRFLVIDRGGPLDNCEEKTVDAATWVST